jgi:uncharacterized membrane protein
MKQRQRLIRVIQTALLAAIVFVVTYLIRIPLPFTAGGSLNLGDTPIYLAAYLLGGPAGAVAGALGSALSDLASGAVFYVAPTAVIKGAMGFVCGVLMNGGVATGGAATQRGGFGCAAKLGDPDAAVSSAGPAKRGDLRRFILASVLGGAIMVGGYALFEVFFFNGNQALAGVPFNCIQWAGGVVAASALFPAVRAVGRTLGQSSA